MADIVTIREAVVRAKSDGLPITEYMLRNWIKAGAIPIRQAGNRKLLYYPNLVSFLRCEDGGDNKTAPLGQMSGQVSGQVVKIRPASLRNKCPTA